MNEIYEVAGGYGAYDICGSESQLEECEIKDIKIIITNWDYLVYSYVQYPYEGDGNMIIKKDGKFMHHSMSHCSCYGPIEHLGSGPWFDSIEYLIETFSNELKKQCEPLILKIKELEKK